MRRFWKGAIIMRTIEEIERDLEIARKEEEPLAKALGEASNKRRKLEEELQQYKLQNGLFTPMSELENHKGESISHIELVVRNEDGSMEIKDMWGDEIFKVNENGHLDYSSYMGGVMYFNSKIEKYEHDFHYHPTIYDFVGYLEVRFYKDEG